MSDPTLVCAALAVEARAVRKGWPRANVATIGMRASRLDAVREHPGPVILLGFGGGLRPTQRPGDVVVAREIRSRQGRVALPASRPALTALRRAGVPATSGPVWCADAIVRGAKRAALEHEAAAVDMESAAVAAACDARRLVVVRVIVDTPRHGLVLASIMHGRRARAVLRRVAATFATDERSAVDEAITSGTVTLAARGATAPHATQEEG